MDKEVVIARVWRSELVRLALFVALSAGCVVLSRMFPSTIISGKLFSAGDSTYILRLPLLWFIPMWPLMSAIFNIYNVRYSMDSRGIESRVGIISMNQSITRIRFEDIRSIETEQTLVERFLDIGLLEMGTAATDGFEMAFSGIASPKKVQETIQRERDARIQRQHGETHRGPQVDVAGNE